MRRTGRGALAVGLLVAASMLSACSYGSELADSSEPTTVTIQRIGTAQSPPARQSSPVPSPTPRPTVPVPAVARDFAWADGDSGLPEAYCLTLLRGLNPTAALHLLAGDTVITNGPQAVKDAYDLTDPDGTGADGSDGYYQAVVAGSRNGWTYVLEDNGFLATEDPATQRLARNGDALVMFENIEADSVIRFARNGHLVREFDPLLYDRSDRHKLPQERGLAFGTDDVGLDHLNALKLTFVRRITGVTLTPADFDPINYDIGVVVHY